MSTMSSLVNVTEGIKTRVLTARTALGSGGSKLNVPFLFSLGSTHRGWKDCQDPVLGKEWIGYTMLTYLPTYLLQWLL